MKIKTTLLLLVAVYSVAFGLAARADIFVIANPSVDLAADDIRDAFIGEKLMVTSIKLIPVDNAQAQAEFLTKVMSLDLNKYNSIWTKKGFRDGLNPPDVKGSDSDVLIYVRKTPGAVGYIAAMPAVTTGFKIIKKY